MSPIDGSPLAPLGLLCSVRKKRGLNLFPATRSIFIIDRFHAGLSNKQIRPGMNPESPRDEEVQAAVEQLLLDRGRFTPVELLLVTGQLRVEDYQAWCRGERARLDDAFASGPRGVRERLEAAETCARALGLVPRRDVLPGSEDNPAGDLAASSDPRLNDLLHTSFHPRASGEPGQQLDLFLDSAATSTVNRLLEALWARDAGAGRQACTRLVALVPDHASAVPAATLIEMLDTPVPDDPERGHEWARRLEAQWAPAALVLFGSGGGEWLAPLWCGIGRALEPAPFDSVHPKRHASWAYLQGGDWENLRRTVLETPAHEDEPVLLARLAEAEYRLRNRIESIKHWFALCWRAPEAFRRLIEAKDSSDATIRDAWHLAEDQDDLEPEMSPAWFPSWMLLHEHGLARELSFAGGESGPERAFALLKALLTSPPAEKASLELRRELGAIHPGLLRRYMAKLEVRHPVGPF